MPGFFILSQPGPSRYATLELMSVKGAFVRMWFIIFGIVFFIEGIIMTVFGVKKKNGMLTYIGIVFSIMTLGIVVLKLTGH
jgi:hypothetical protein